MVALVDTDMRQIIMQFTCPLTSNYRRNYRCYYLLSLLPTTEPSGCPFPHWPPVIPPIVAILLSLLMIPCYCYACGPWSGAYWAEQRRKVIVEDQYYGQQPQQPPNTNTRQLIAVNGYGDGARLRPLTNGYGRL